LSFFDEPSTLGQLEPTEAHAVISFNDNKKLMYKTAVYTLVNGAITHHQKPQI